MDVADAPVRRPAEARARWKQELKDGRARLQQQFLERGHPHAVLVHQRELTDRVLADVWNTLAMPDGLALIAVGGYGRGLMFPYSDVDILVLLPAAQAGEGNRQIEEFVGTLWDIGMEVGHSTRTIEECVDQLKQDVSVQTNLLEARLLRGDTELFERFREACANAMDDKAFCEAKLLEQQQRHQRFNDVAYSLEPNIKENPGGLRDLQVILWITRACGLGESWRDLTQHGIITEQEAARLARHEGTLQALRVRLHFMANRREDRLLFDHQSRLARDLGFVDTPARRASEQLMQRFYRTAKAVLQLSSIVLANLRTRILPPPETGTFELTSRFEVRNQLLEARRADLYERQPHAILETFLLWQRHPEVKGLGAKTLRALWHARRQINAAFRHDPRNRALFMEILREPAGLTHTLRRLNKHGLLGLYVPAFGRIVGRMQHDLFHVYTVDEHILMVVRNMRRFAIPEMAHEYPLCSRLMSGFDRREVLYLAALFHDIAKGRGGDHSELGKHDAIRFCKAHGLSAEDTELVGWLVQYHLTMSSTAQKRDLADPEVIRDFARLVGDDRRLVALYLLTVADIRGTSPKVWNAWKAKLLEDLFRATQRCLGGSPAPIEGSVQHTKNEVLAKLRAYALPEGVEMSLWSQLSDSYFLQHDAQEVAWHTRLLNYRVDTKVPVVKARLSPIGEGLQVMIYCPDRNNLFAQICSFFEKISFSIVEAKVHTTRHGWALDSFQVMDPSDTRSHYRDLISYIEHELAEKLTANAPLDAPARGRVSRQLKAFPITPEVVIRPDERGRFHYLSLIAGDRPGLLFRVARILAQYGISVQNAKINTLGARAEDTFLLSGEALQDQRKVVKLEADLIHELEA
ncbi:MAG: [protein-PII] uridylyltransferase [Burkholderiales bacterium]|nr:[protein-PII] uridylyltransferase [Burkholderiales bacterium]